MKVALLISGASFSAVSGFGLNIFQRHAMRRYDNKHYSTPASLAAATADSVTTNYFAEAVIVSPIS